MFCLSTPQLLYKISWKRLSIISLFQFLFLIGQPASFGQTTYYVAATGNDANNGTSPNTPFQSLTKVSNLPLQPGDVVLFRRGDTFRETLYIYRSGSASQPLVYDAYGSGPKPILAGSIPVTNWSNVGGNVWQASCPACGNSVTGLYRDDTALPLGRYPNLNAPNKGYLTIGSHTGYSQIVSQEPLPNTVDWTGGEAVMRPNQWIIDRARINSQSGNALNISYSSSYPPGDGWGYFIQNHPATLDQNGEWYYDATNKIIRLFSDQNNPNSQAIAATIYGRGIHANLVSNIKVRNLHITQSLHEGVYAYNVSNFMLSDNDITNSGEDGLRIQGVGTNLLFENNSITEVNNNGVSIDAYQSVTFRGNKLRRIGMQPGRGKAGDGQYNGMQSTANENVLIENNTIDSVGYNGLTFGNNTVIQQNVISNYCMTKSDGGAIYAWNGLRASMTNIHILSNIVYNGIGAPEGSFRQEYAGANGIFLDDCVENVEVRNNTIFNNIQWGIFLHAVSHVSFTDNTSFNNGVSQIAIYHNGDDCPVRNTTGKRNIFVSKLPSQFTGQYESFTDDFAQYGTIDSNYYARPFSEGATLFGYVFGSHGGNQTLSEWRNFSGGQDMHSKPSPITYKEYKNDGAGGTNRVKSAFDTDLDNWYVVYSNYNNAEAALDNTNKLDGNSLRVSFPNPSGHADSYAQAIRRIGTLTKGKTYVLRFDAIASSNVNILVYLRSYGPPYVEYDRRYTASLSPTRTSYEFPFVPSAEGIDPIIMFQIDGEGPVFWLDNIRLQEDVPMRNNPDEFIRLFYNPTLKDSVITLSDIYRDVKNQAYRQSITLKPFTSIILLKDTLPVSQADLSLSMWSNKRVLQVNESTSLRIRVSNQSNTQAALARWTYRLPANLEFIQDDGQVYSDNVMTGTVHQLPPLTDTIFTVVVRPTVAGLFRTAAQITTATSPDPDSNPNSGTADGEDDTAMTDLRVLGPAPGIFESPNPNQRLLPAILSNQPNPDPSQSDLSLRMEVNLRAPALGEIITYTLYVSNAGGRTADGVRLENQLPDGFELVNTAGWTTDGPLLKATLDPIEAGTTRSLSFQVRSTVAGDWINRAQISASNAVDPDSTPGNGFNGEDDEAQADIRSR